MSPFPGRRRILARGAGCPYLAVLLCYNDDDMLAPVIAHLAANRHDVVVWNHGSEDRTGEIALAHLGRGVVEYQAIDRAEVPFKALYETCSRYLAAEYAGRYEWLSWPDQDEILEGPDLARPYHEHVAEALAAGIDWVEFDNFVFWFTDEDDAAEPDPVKRIRRYNLYVCPPRIRAWRFSRTNVRRLGNSNPIEGTKSPVNWPLRHYPMRSAAQARRRAEHDRNQPGFQFSDKNWHYERFRDDASSVLVPAAKLHRFDGRTLSRDVTFEFYKRPDRLGG
ncbi:MAG: hypothetical protein HMLKMBBP_02501 [Planctomycetes bacterium]|nr:hypothetical protein [Planctomycetota bacterium]